MFNVEKRTNKQKKQHCQINSCFNHLRCRSKIILQIPKEILINPLYSFNSFVAIKSVFLFKTLA